MSKAAAHRPGAQKFAASPQAHSAKLLVRIILVALYIGLGALMLFTGRKHTILIDNKTVGEYQAVDGLSISVDGQEAVEYYEGDRDKLVVQGQSHRIRIEVLSDGKVTEKKFTVPLMEDMTLLSAPALLGGAASFTETFVPIIDRAPPEEPEAATTPDQSAPDQSAPPASTLIQ